MRPGPIVLLAALMIGATGAAAAADDSNPLGLGMVETPDLRLIYQSPTLDYLLPHTIQTFTNSLRWQRERFGWVPSQPVTVMLKDFSDYGNAGATPMPFNTLRVEVSPASNAFETNPSSERMYSLMNHELVHLATTDIATASDRRWRGLLLGKVPPQPKHPETLLYSYLTVPRFNVPRWLLEGAAVFMPFDIEKRIRPEAQGRILLLPLRDVFSCAPSSQITPAAIVLVHKVQGHQACRCG